MISRDPYDPYETTPFWAGVLVAVVFLVWLFA